MDTSQVEGQIDVCNKDTGGKKTTLQKWSRGLHHFVRGGGIIDKFDALFVLSHLAKYFTLRFTTSIFASKIYQKTNGSILFCHMTTCAMLTG